MTGLNPEDQEAEGQFRIQGATQRGNIQGEKASEEISLLDGQICLMFENVFRFRGKIIVLQVMEIGLRFVEAVASSHCVSPVENGEKGRGDAGRTGLIALTHWLLIKLYALEGSNRVVGESCRRLEVVVGGEGRVELEKHVKGFDQVSGIGRVGFVDRDVG